MAKKVTKTKSSRKIGSKRSTSNVETNRLTAAAAVLFTGGIVAAIGIMQNNDDIKLLLVGFSAALLVLGGVLVGMSTKPLKR